MAKPVRRPDQASLLPPQPPEAESATPPVPESGAPLPEPIFGTTETPVKVSLETRRKNLIESLRLLGGVNQRYGLERASDPASRGTYDELANRFAGELEQRVEKAKANRDTGSEATGTGVGQMAREHFYTAFGHLVMLNGMRKEDVDNMRGEEWKDFQEHFSAQPHGRKRRAKYIDKLEEGKDTDN